MLVTETLEENQASVVTNSLPSRDDSSSCGGPCLFCLEVFGADVVFAVLEVSASVFGRLVVEVVLFGSNNGKGPFNIQYARPSTSCDIWDPLADLDHVSSGEEPISELTRYTSVNKARVGK